MSSTPTSFEFVPPALGAVAVAMAERADAATGWINLDPAIDPVDAPRIQPGFFGLFTGRGPALPRATYVPATGDGPASVGVHHGAGPKAAALLADVGLATPDEWRIVQDHPKRGLVAELPGGVELEAVLDWLVAATIALARVPLEGHWRATVHDG